MEVAMCRRTLAVYGCGRDRRIPRRGPGEREKKSLFFNRALARQRGAEGTFLARVLGVERVERTQRNCCAVPRRSNPMYIGIDPGLSGALAMLAADGALVALRDVPTLTL